MSHITRHRMLNPAPRNLRGRGFSLIEVMVVVVIIGMLAGAVAIKVSSYMDTAKVNRARSDMATIVDAVETFNLQKSRYPTNDEGLTVLPLKNTADPWGNPYGYNSPSSTSDAGFEIICFGADGREGGEGINSDLYSWQLAVEAAER